MGFWRNHTRNGRDQDPGCGSDHALAGDTPIVLPLNVAQFHFKDVQNIQTLRNQRIGETFPVLFQHGVIRTPLFGFPGIASLALQSALRALECENAVVRFLKVAGSCGNGTYQLQVIIDSGEAVLPVVDQLKVLQIVKSGKNQLSLKKFARALSLFSAFRVTKLCLALLAFLIRSLFICTQSGAPRLSYSKNLKMG